MLDVLQDMKKGRMAQTAPAVKAPDSNAGTATKTSKKQLKKLAVGHLQKSFYASKGHVAHSKLA